MRPDVNFWVKLCAENLKYYVDILGVIICTKKFEIKFDTVCMFVQSRIVISFDLWDHTCLYL